MDGNLPPRKRIKLLLRDGHSNHNQKPGFFDQICEHDDVLLYLCTNHLEPEDVLQLYSISKTFRHSLNQQFMSYIIVGAKEHLKKCVPLPMVQHGADAIAESVLWNFPWKFYKKFCVIDPAANMVYSSLDGSENDGSQQIIAKDRTPLRRRMVPGFKYLWFLRSRLKTMYLILASLQYRYGLRTSPKTAITLGKIWLLIDFPLNKPRIMLIQNRVFWTDLDLLLATQFFMKLEMAFQEPAQGPGATKMLQLMMAQRSLTTLAQTTRGRGYPAPFDLMRLYIHWKYQVYPKYRDYSLFGIPAHLVGALDKDGQGRGWVLHGQALQQQNPGQRFTRPQHLFRPDELIRMESLRRQLDWDRKYADLIMSGFIDERTGKPYPPEPFEEWEEELMCEPMEWFDDDMQDGSGL